MGYSLSYFLVPTILILVGIRKFQTYKWGRCNNKTRLSKKVVIITGANSGIGYEIAKELAGREAHVIMACRNVNAASDAISKLKKEIPNAVLIAMELDLASLKSVKKFADEIKKNYSKIELLINNAGVFYPTDMQEQKTVDGFEIHFGTNHLGHFYLTNLLLDLLKATEGSRIIIISSKLHESGKILADDLTMERVGNIKGYPSSKLANVYFCIELAKRLHGSSVHVYSLCPGWVYTSLFKNYTFTWYKLILVLPMAFFFMRTPKQGAQTPIYCATEPQLDSESGFIYRDCKKYNSKVVFDPVISSKLWSLSENLINKVMS